MIETMDKQAAKRVGDAVAKALDGVARELGLRLVMKGGRFDPVGGTFSPKVEFKLAGEAGAQAVRKQFEHYASMFGLDPAWYGKTFLSGDTTYMVVGLDLKRRKRPVIGARSTDGRRFVFTTEQVRVAMGVPAGRGYAL
jgi:hypothetical protein